MKIDLHCHSDASDGIRSPDLLYKIAKDNNLSVFSLTDHDTTEGAKKILELNKKDEDNKKPFFIPGIELSTLYKGENIHILGYFKDDTFLSDEFENILQNFRNRRDSRGLEMVRRLKEFYDIEIDINDLDLKNGSSLGRPHLAQLIKEKYKVPFDEVFKKYLGKHTKAFIPSSKIDTNAGIDLLKRMGAVVIMAHPGEYKLSLEELAIFPFDGFECYYPKHSIEYTKTLTDFCKNQGLLITSGSDDHGIPGDTKHGILGSTPLDPQDLLPFLSKFNIKLEDL
ncbi:MAG: PHP domain-containing protein [Clostridiaceae bacterium]